MSTWMFKNERKVLFLTLTETGSYGYVIDTERTPWARHATEDDKRTEQYTEAHLVRPGELRPTMATDHQRQVVANDLATKAVDDTK